MTDTYQVAADVLDQFLNYRILPSAIDLLTSTKILVGSITLPEQERIKLHANGLVQKVSVQLSLKIASYMPCITVAS